MILHTQRPNLGRTISCAWLPKRENCSHQLRWRELRNSRWHDVHGGAWRTPGRRRSAGYAPRQLNLSPKINRNFVQEVGGEVGWIVDAREAPCRGWDTTCGLCAGLLRVMRGGVLLNFLKSNLLGLCDDTMWLPFAHSSRNISGVRRSTQRLPVTMSSGWRRCWS